MLISKYCEVKYPITTDKESRMQSIMVSKCSLVMLAFFSVFSFGSSSDKTHLGFSREGSIKALEDSIEDVISISQMLKKLKNLTGCADEEKQFTMIAFTAVMTISYSLGSGEKVPYNNVISNIGLGYDVTNRIFTAPTSGIYTVSVSMMAKPTNSVHLKLMKDGNEIVRLWTQKDRYELSSQTVNIPLYKGSQIWVQQFSGSILHNSEPYNVFSAALIAEGSV